VTLYFSRELPVQKETGPEARVRRIIELALGDMTGVSTGDQIALAERLVAIRGELAEAFIRGSQKAGQALQKAAVGTLPAFTIIDRQATSYAERRAGQLVVQISDEQRALINGITVRAVNGKLTQAQAARRIQSVVGLHDRWQKAVINFQEQKEQSLLNAGWSPERASASASTQADRYAQRLTRARARTISRTEIIQAQNAGHYQGVINGMTAGTIAQGTYLEWMTAEDEKTCPICQPLNGKVVRAGEEFQSGLRFPPVHPNCRCTFSELPPDYADDPMYQPLRTQEDIYVNGEPPTNWVIPADLADPDFSAEAWAKLSTGNRQVVDAATAYLNPTIAPLIRSGQASTYRRVLGQMLKDQPVPAPALYKTAIDFTNIAARLHEGAVLEPAEFAFEFTEDEELAEGVLAEWKEALNESLINFTLQKATGLPVSKLRSAGELPDLKEWLVDGRLEVVAAHFEPAEGATTAAGVAIGVWKLDLAPYEERLAREVEVVPGMELTLAEQSLLWPTQHPDEGEKVEKYAPGQARDSRGRFTDGLGGAVSGIRHPDGGFTFNPLSGKTASKGYAVSPYPELEHVISNVAKMPDDELRDAITAYAMKNRAIIARPDHYLGGWHDPDSGDGYIDVSIVRDTAEAAHQTAVQHKQKAYFDFQTGKSVDVTGGAQ
jgi:SPP1 gp7 family putative phage head morphogenesis protein